MAGFLINEARSVYATRAACSYKAEPPLTDPPEALGWTREEWDTLSPGSKMAIELDLRRRGLIDPLCSEPASAKTLKERRAEVEYAGRKRL